MITAEAVLATARERGIFALPTSAGELGPLLLSSLGLDLGDPTVREQLYALYVAGELDLMGRYSDWALCERSLRARGLAPELLGASHHQFDVGFHAFAVWIEAVPATGDTVTKTQISTIWRRGCDEGVHGNPDIMHLTTVAENAHGDFTPEEQKTARAACAAIWNQIAGVLSQDG